MVALHQLGVLGAVGAAIWGKANEQSAKDYVIPLSSGIIAGVSIMGVLVAFLNNVVLAGG